MNSCTNKTTILENDKNEEIDSAALNLSFLFHDTLKMSFMDTKCGEWGGDSKSIRVYKKYLKYPKEIILMDVREFKMNCDSISPHHQPEKILLKEKIVASKSMKILLIKAIQEIMELKLNSSSIVSNSGAFSGMRTMDSTFYITIYPSPQWTNFNKLFLQLKKSKK